MDKIPEMTSRQEVFAVFVAVALLLFVVDLVRRRRLGEEYSWLWILASTTVLVVVVWPTALKAITVLSGAFTPTTTVFMLGILFLVVVCIHLCTKLTQANEQTKRIAQQVAIMRARAVAQTAGRREQQ